MKFDPFMWAEVTTSASHHAEGFLGLRLSAPSAVYIVADGFEALLGYGTSFDADIAGLFEYRVEGPKGVRFFQYVPPAVSFDSQGEVYTNADRLPFQSGQVYEVQRALRMQQLMQRDMMAEIRQATAELRASRAPAAPAASAVSSDEAEGTSDAEGS